MPTTAQNETDTSGVVDQLATEIRVEMTRLRRTTVAAGTHFGVTASTIRRKLTGDTALSVADLIGFADWLGVPAADLLARAEAHAVKKSA